MAPAQSDLQPQSAPKATAAAQAAIGDGLVAEAQAFANELAAWRHDLHQTPELGNNLPQTSAFIQARLDEMDIPYAVLVDGTCVVGLIGAGAAAAARGNGTCTDKQAGTVIMLRGDMDALPVAEESGEPFASTNGCMHACGHDMHATALLGAARLLKAREAELVDANATVKLLFQPGEETFEGARAAIADGLLENPRPQAAFAMHVNSQSPLGLVLYGSPALSGVYGFRITLQGKGGHGSSPEICIDPITAAAHIHIALQEINARELSQNDFGVLTTGRFAAGAASNVIPDTAEMWGTIRTTDPDDKTGAFIRQRMTEISEGVAKAFRCTAEVEFSDYCPCMMVDKALAQDAMTYMTDLLGKGAMDMAPLTGGKPGGGSEDFAFVSHEVPTVSMFLACGSPERGYRYGQHHPKVRFDDSVLWEGSAAYSYFALRWLEGHR